MSRLVRKSLGTRGRGIVRRVFSALTLAALLASCNHTQTATAPPGLTAIGLVISNVQLTGPETISVSGGPSTFTVTYDAQVQSNFTAASPMIVVRDQDLLPENIPIPGDDFLLNVAATGIPPAPPGNTTAQALGATDSFNLVCAPTLVGLTVQSASGSDSGEGGTNVFGSDAADIYVELNGQRSNVLLVSCVD